MLAKTEKIQIPKVGMLAIIRRRRGGINEVREFDGEVGRFHIVSVDYKDDIRPSSDRVSAYSNSPIGRCLLTAL